MQDGFHPSLDHPGHRRRLLRLKRERVDEEEDDPLLRRERGHNRQHGVGDLHRVLGRFLCRYLCGDPEAGNGPICPTLIDPRVGRDPEQVGPGLQDLTEVVEASERLEQRLLHEILGIPGRAGQARAVPPERRPVLGDLPFERRSEIT
jgi:hypothetical protein